MSLKIWLPLNGSIINQGLSQTHTITNNSTTLNANGGKVTANCATFSSGNYITISDANTIIPINNKQISIAFWMKSTNTDNQCLFCNRTQTGYGISIFKLNKTQFRFDTGNGGMTTFSGLQETYPNWTHFCFTWDGKIKRLYVNGINISSLTCESNIDNYGNKIYLGISCSNTDTGASLGNKFIGSLNDYRIYDHCLSPREVKLLAQGLVAHYKLDNSGNFDPERLSNTTHSLSTINGATSVTWGNYFDYPCFKIEIHASSFAGWSGCYMSCVPTNYGAQIGDTVTRSCKFYVPSGQNIPDMFREHHEQGGTLIKQVSYDRTKCDTWQTVSQTVTVGANSSGKVSNLLHYFYAADVGYPAVDFVCYARDFQLEYGAEVTEFTPLLPSNIEYDCSGYGNHGTASAFLETSADSPRYSHSTIFKDNKCISTSRTNYAGMNNTYSFVYWARMNGDTMNNKMVWGFYGSGNHYLDFYPINNKFTLNNGSVNTNLQFGDGVDIITDKQWHHYAIVGDIDKALLYIDGIFKGQTNGLFTIPNAPLILSGWHKDLNNYRWNDGQISDFRMYATPLSEAAVKEIYASSISFLDNGTLQCSEIVEKDTNIKYNKNGIVNANLLSEINYVNRMKIKQLDSDKSLWARIYWLDVSGGKSYFSHDEAKHYLAQDNRFSYLDQINQFYTSGLPTGYKRLDYIQPGGDYLKGSSYIDTGIVPDHNTKIVLSYTHNSENEFGALFGARVKTTEQVFGAWIGDSGGYYYPHWGNNSYELKPITGIPLTKQRIYVMDKNNHRVYGTGGDYTRLSTNSSVMKSTAHTATTFYSSRTLALFAMHSNDGYDERRARGKLYFCQIYQNGKLIRDFIPCINDKNIVGLYDLVTRTFYTKHNSADSDFIAGNIINGHIELLLNYPKINATRGNRWRQTSGIDQTTVDNFFPMETTWSNRNGGLCLSPTQNKTIYDCDAHQGNWFAPIGQFAKWDSNDIPAADGSTSTTETELWVRIDQLSHLLKLEQLSMSNEAFASSQIYEL